MAEDIWRWADPSGQQRRVRIDELRASLASGAIAPNTPVWKPGWKGWQSAHEVPELTTSALSAANGVIPNIPPPPLAVVAVQHQFEAQGAESFRPPPPDGGTGEEPPPPPTYIPVPTKAPSLTPPAPSSSQRLIAPGLPTAIGLPPPPELQQLAQNAALGRTKSPPTSGSSTADPMVEELSGSMLLDEGGANGLPPPSVPIQHEMTSGSMDDVELPVRSPFHSIIRDVKEVRAGRPPQNKKKLIAAGVIAGAGVILVLSLFIALVSAIFGSSDKKTDTGPAGSSSAVTTGSGRAATFASSTTTAISTVVTPPPTKPPPASGGFGECTATGDAKPLGWRAMVGSGIDVEPLSGSFALGFATSQRDGVAVMLDSALAPTSTAKSRAAGGEAKHVTPMIVGGKLVAVTDGDRKGDRLAGRRTVATIPPIDLGVADGTLAWAPHAKDSWAKLFDVGDGPVEALRAVPLGADKGIAFAFRSGNAIKIGAAKGENMLAAAGTLQEMQGLGQVGSPSITTSGTDVIVAWSDRPAGGGDTPWQVRWTRMTPGEAAKPAVALALPDGGLGTQAMSPSVAGLGGGRFIIAWTEGPISGHQVRAITIGADGAAGAPLTISAGGVNAGQPDVAVGGDGKGVVAFLAAKGRAFEVHATPISCAAR
jgi:hypothetical protein